MTDSEKKTRKASEKHPVKVMKLTGVSGVGAGECWVFVDNIEHDSTADADDWTKHHGVHGTEYMIVTVRKRGTFTRTPVTKEVTSFA